MRIGELAEQAGCSVETVRYYEREGLMPAPRRTEGNYREYRVKHSERLAFILRCRSLDMSLLELRRLLEAIERPDANCDPVDALLDEHIEHVATRIGELKQLKSELDAIREHCHGSKPARHCGILAVLSRPEPKRRANQRHVRATHGKR